MRKLALAVAVALIALPAADAAEAGAKKRKLVITEKKTEVRVPAGSTASAKVPCRRAGVVGGGYHDSGGDEGIVIVDQGPNRKGKRWKMTLGNTTSTIKTATVGAHCIKGRNGLKARYAKGRGAVADAAGRRGKFFVATVQRDVQLAAGRNIVLLECPRGFLPFSFLGAPPAILEADPNRPLGLEFERMVERTAGRKAAIQITVSVEREQAVNAMLFCWRLADRRLDFDTHSGRELGRSPKNREVNIKLIDLFGEIPGKRPSSTAAAPLAAATGRIGQSCPTDNAVVIHGTPLPPPSAQLIGNGPRSAGTGWDGEFLGGGAGESFGQITSCLQGGKKIRIRYRG